MDDVHDCGVMIVATANAAAPFAVVSHDGTWWAAESARLGSDWSGVVEATLGMMVVGGIIEGEAESMGSWGVPSWREAVAEYHRDRHGHRLAGDIEPARLRRLRRLMADGISLDRAWYAANADRPTPEAAVDAVKLSVRERGMKAFDEPANQWRLKRCDAATRRQLDHWIANFQGNCR